MVRSGAGSLSLSDLDFFIGRFTCLSSDPDIHLGRYGSVAWLDMDLYLRKWIRYMVGSGYLAWLSLDTHLWKRSPYIVGSGYLSLKLDDLYGQIRISILVAWMDLDPLFDQICISIMVRAFYG